MIFDKDVFLLIFEMSPSVARLPLYRGDVVSLLGLVAALLPSLVSCPEQVVGAGDLHSPVLALHRRAQLLLAVAAVKAAPIEMVTRYKQVT